MKASTFFLFTLKSFAVAFSPLKPRAAGCQPALLDAATNIWKNYTLHPNPVYQRQVLEGAARIQDADLKTKALKIADVGSFIWLCVATKISLALVTYTF